MNNFLIGLALGAVIAVIMTNIRHDQIEKQNAQACDYQHSVFIDNKLYSCEILVEELK